MHFYAVYYYDAVVDAVNHHLIKIGDQQLQVIYRYQRQQTHKNEGGKTQIIAIDMFAENHTRSPFYTNPHHYITGISV